MATYAIGDLQGCADDFLALLHHIDFDARRDRLWLAGDLVNRGPDSLGTLRYVRNLGDAALSVLGNHDLHLLAASLGTRPNTPSDTLQDILEAPDRDALIDWLRHRPMAHAATLAGCNYLLVHAGVLPQWSVADVMRLAGEVEQVLRGPHWAALVSRMYGDGANIWHADLEGEERLRVIINALTRLRFCTADGVMDLKTKESAAAALPGYQPWFDVPGRLSQTLTVIHGHWSTLGLRNTPNHLALDTGCVWGGQLTAVRLEDRQVFGVSCARHRSPGVHA